MTQHSMRHPLQLIVSLGQIYGLVLYYGTSMFDHYHYNIAYSRPEAYYFWGYYFLMNFFWIVFPGSEFDLCIINMGRSPNLRFFTTVLMYNSCRAISTAMKAFHKNEPTPKMNLRSSGKKAL